MLPRTQSKIDLSDASVALLQPAEGKAELMVWDQGVPGLALRIGRRKRTWIFVYRPDGAGRAANPQKFSLGQWPTLEVKAARKAARVQAGLIANGKDPATVRREEKRRDRASVSSILDEYEASLKARKYANTATTMSTLRRNLTAFRGRDISTITRIDIVRQVERIEAAGKPGAASDFRRHARTLLEWTTNQGSTAFNVLAGLRRPRSTRAQRITKEEDGKALTDQELKAVWLAADPAKSFGRYVRALILSGARRQEMSRLHRRMVLADRLKLPPTHTKQGRPHEIPIVPALGEVLRACPLVPSKLLFASARSGGEMKGWTQLVAGIVKRSGVDFTLHDLRRTMRSGLSRLGVAEDIAELSIGHQREELIRLYNKDDAWAKRVDAASKWADHVCALCNAPQGDNVVMIGAGQAA